MGKDQIQIFRDSAGGQNHKLGSVLSSAKEGIVKAKQFYIPDIKSDSILSRLLESLPKEAASALKSIPDLSQKAFWVLNGNDPVHGLDSEHAI